MLILNFPLFKRGWWLYLSCSSSLSWIMSDLNWQPLATMMDKHSYMPMGPLQVSSSAQAHGSHSLKSPVVATSPAGAPLSAEHSTSIRFIAGWELPLALSAVELATEGGCAATVIVIRVELPAGVLATECHPPEVLDVGWVLAGVVCLALAIYNAIREVLHVVLAVQWPHYLSKMREWYTGRKFAVQ